jgi:hypothetical protein
VSAAVHYCDYVIYGVGWVAAVIARGVALQDDCAVAFVFWVAVFFTHCYRAASGLLSFAVVVVAYRVCLCVGLLSVCHLYV